MARVTLSSPAPSGSPDRHTPFPVEKKVPQTERDKAIAEYKSTVENKWGNIVLGASGVSALGLIAGAMKWGSSHPSKVLQVLGDGIGSVSALAAPAAIISNEISNFNLIKDGKDTSIGNRFDDWREGFYRASSIGFFPFIFQPFVDPEKIGKSIFHKAAFVGNIPNLLFTGYAWGFGNVKALGAWFLKMNAKGNLAKVSSDDTVEHEKAKARLEVTDDIYQSCKRLARIGSIANPTMQGLRQCADSLAFLTGSMSLSELFERPFLGISRITSLFSGIPEVFSKGIDSLERVTKEYEHLRLALPKPLREPLEKWSKEIQSQLSTREDNWLQRTRHNAEVLFHTISPLSMFALFIPLLDEKHSHDALQTDGGIPAKVDNFISGYGKALTWIFTGSYAFFARLPQAVFQLAYFSKVGFKRDCDYKNEAESQIAREKVETVKKSLVNNSVVNGVSGVFRSAIEWLVPDFYTNEENLIDYGYGNYEQIQGKYAFEQTKESEAFKHLFDKEQRKNLSSEELTIKKDEFGKFVEDFARREAFKGGYKTISTEEVVRVREVAERKLAQQLGEVDKPKRKLPKFPGAEFLVRYLLKLGDLKTRIEKIDYKSSHHNMVTAYDNDEIRISFEGELMPVVAKCTKGLGDTLNRLYSLFGMAA